MIRKRDINRIESMLTMLYDEVCEIHGTVKNYEKSLREYNEKAQPALKDIGNLMGKILNVGIKKDVN